MNLHFCGNLAHDVPMLALWVISFAPDWTPAIGLFRAKLRESLGAHRV
jgi:hypothetical protein